MSFAEKVHSRLLALESQVQALDKRLKALESLEAPTDIVTAITSQFDPEAHAPLGTPILTAMKRKPGRPKKVVNG